MLGLFRTTPPQAISSGHVCHLYAFLIWTYTDPKDVHETLGFISRPVCRSPPTCSSGAVVREGGSSYPSGVLTTDRIVNNSYSRLRGHTAALPSSHVSHKPQVWLVDLLNVPAAHHFIWKNSWDRFCSAAHIALCIHLFLLGKHPSYWIYFQLVFYWSSNYCLFWLFSFTELQWWDL